MPYIFKHRRPPPPWREFRTKTLHPSLRPLYYFNWLGEWAAYFLGRWSIFELLEYAGSFSILLAVIFYFADAPARRRQKHDAAWQVLNTAQGKGGSGGRIDALRELNRDRIPLIGVDVSDAYLEGVELPNADLRRADLRGCDLRRALFREADLEGAKLRSANLRDADLTAANLTDASLADADLAGARLSRAHLRGATLDRADLRRADLRELRDWRSIRSIQGANIHGLLNPPEGFIAWAKANGAVDGPEEGK
jgi:hypothetical protein